MALPARPARRCMPSLGARRGLHVVPGSHRQGVIAHAGAEKQISAEEWQQAGPVPVPLQPGEAIAFDPCLLHASDPNRSARPRRALMLRYHRLAGTHAG